MTSTTVEIEKVNPTIQSKQSNCLPICALLVALVGVAMGAAGLAVALPGALANGGVVEGCVSVDSQPPDITGAPFSSHNWVTLFSENDMSNNYTASGRISTTQWFPTAHKQLVYMSRMIPCGSDAPAETCTDFVVEGQTVSLAASSSKTACVWTYLGCQYNLVCVDDEDVALRTVIPRSIDKDGVVQEILSHYLETGPPHMLSDGTPNGNQAALASWMHMKRDAPGSERFKAPGASR